MCAHAHDVMCNHAHDALCAHAHDIVCTHSHDIMCTHIHVGELRVLEAARRSYVNVEVRGQQHGGHYQKSNIEVTGSLCPCMWRHNHHVPITLPNKNTDVLSGERKGRTSLNTLQETFCV